MSGDGYILQIFTNLQMDKDKVIYPELSYKIIGLLFGVWDEIGYSHKEKYIQNAVAEALNISRIPFKEQVRSDLNFKNAKIGLYFF